MSTIEELRDGLGQALFTVAEGWHQLRQRAAQALTRFTSERPAGEVETAADQVAGRASRWGLLAAELRENDTHLALRLEAPGLDPDDFEIRVVDDYLVVGGEKRVERERRHGHYHMMECAYGRFERAIPLPAAVDEDHIEARYRQGVLTVILPKVQPSRTNRIKIKVQS